MFVIDVCTFKLGLLGQCIGIIWQGSIYGYSGYAFVIKRLCMYGIYAYRNGIWMHMRYCVCGTVVGCSLACMVFVCTRLKFFLKILHSYMNQSQLHRIKEWKKQQKNQIKNNYDIV